MSFLTRLALVSTVAVLAACAEDLTAVNAAFAATSASWQKAIDEGKKAAEGLVAKIGELPAVGDADATGKDLKAKLDAALGTHKETLTNLEQVVSETKAAVEKAQAEKKILPVETAMKAGVEKFNALLPKLGEAATAATSGLDALKAHLDAEAAKAKAAADPAAKDAEAVKAAGGEAGGFTFIYTDKGAVDEAQSASAIERLTKLLASCDALKVDLVATGVEDKAKERAEALKKLMDGKGGKGKIVSAKGAAGDGSTKVVVATPCP